MTGKKRDTNTYIAKNFGTLIFREFLIKLFSFFGQLMLARFLFPSDFGIYVIIVFIVNFFSFFSDLGFSLAIIQTEEKPSKEQLSSVFFLKLFLSLTIILIIWFFSPYIKFIYSGFSDSYITLLRLFSFTLIFSSLRVVSTALLEREIRYKEISFVDVVGVFVYYAVALILAFLQFGVVSFILGAILKEITETILIFFVKPFIPKLKVSLKSIKKILKFGAYIQGNSFVNFLNNSIIPVLGGVLSGPFAVGLLDFADSIGSFPENIAINFGRVAFAGYSRIQKQRKLLFTSINKSVSLLSILLYIFPVIILSFGAEFISDFYTANWQPAIPSLYFFSLAAFFLPIMASFGQGILSIGKSKDIFKATLLITVLGWALAFFLVKQVGFVGIAISNIFFELFLCILYIKILKENNLSFPLVNILLPKLLVVLVCLFIGSVSNMIFPVNILSFGLKLVIISLSYVLLMHFFARKDLAELFKTITIWVKKND